MSLMTIDKMQAIIEAALMVAGHPLTVAALQNLFPEDERPNAADIKSLIQAIQESYANHNRGIEIKEVSSGFRIQAKTELSPWLSKLWEERAPRYSRAFLETLVLIAYKQPITRAEIEEIRGVTVSTNIMKTLQEREWIRVLGYREVPGRPAIYGTTKEFLDYFNLKSLSELPTLAEIKNFEAQEAQLQVELAIQNSNVGPENSEAIPAERDALAHEEDNEHDNNVVAIGIAGVKDESVAEEIAAENSEVVEEAAEAGTETEEEPENTEKDIAV